MSFVITRTARAWWPVKFPGVADDGSVVENAFEMRFRLLDEDEQAIVERQAGRLAEDVDPDSFVPSQAAASLVMRIAEDWRGVEIDDGDGEGARSLQWSADNLATLLKVPNVYLAVLAAYRECRAGGRRGN